MDNTSNQALISFALLFKEMRIGPLWLSRHNIFSISTIKFNNFIVDISDKEEKKEKHTQKIIKKLPVCQQYNHNLSSSYAVKINKTKTLSSPLNAVNLLCNVPSIINSNIYNMKWDELKNAVSNCRQCNLCENRKHTVFGVGDKQAKWLFIGEGPGKNEDQQGEPFVGPAGKLLDNMLLTLGLKRGNNVYIANIVKCRPIDINGKDRPPSIKEIGSCIGYLQRQISLIQPTILIALGRTAAISLLGLDSVTSVSKLRGIVHNYHGLPLIVTYHPAYLLRQLIYKSKAWVDLCLAMSSYSHIISQEICNN